MEKEKSKSVIKGQPADGDWYKRMIDEVEDYAILWLSPEGTIMNWNTGAQKIKGYTSDEAIGKNFRIFYTERDRLAGLPDSLLKEATEKGKALHEGWRMRRDGTVFWGSVVITAIHDAKRNVIGFNKVTRDLSERKKMEDTLMRYIEQLKRREIELNESQRKLEGANKELQHSNRELASFGYVASHDLQEPLRKINMFVNRIMEGAEPLPATAVDYLNRILDSSYRMQKLINDLLTFSGIQNAPKNFEPVSLDDVLSEMHNLHKELEEEGKLILEADHLPTVTGISFQLVQLFENLIGNSIKYAKKDEPAHIIITDETMDPDKYYHIRLQDFGIGFEQVHAEKIFEVFQRLHGKDEYTGTGIGLSICRKIMENHGGRITASGEPGKGVKFELWFPK